MAKFSTLLLLHDPVRAGVIRSLLEQSGIQATTVGLNHSSLLGAAGAWIEISIQVPADQLDRAREIVEGLEAQDSELVETDEQELFEAEIEPEAPLSSEEQHGPYRSSARSTSAPIPKPRLRRFAAFCALVLTFGFGHYYARQRVTGWILGTCQVGLIVAAFEDPNFLLGVPVLVAWDLFGSVSAVRRANENRRLGTLPQLGIASIAVAAAALTGPMIGPYLPPPQTDNYYYHYPIEHQSYPVSPAVDLERIICREEQPINYYDDDCDGVVDEVEPNP